MELFIDFAVTRIQLISLSENIHDIGINSQLASLRIFNQKPQVHHERNLTSGVGLNLKLTITKRANLQTQFIHRVHNFTAIRRESYALFIINLTRSSNDFINLSKSR